MAKAIRRIEKAPLDPAQERRRAADELAQKAADGADALGSLVELLQEAHRAGLLDAANGLLKARSEVAQIAIEQLNQPNMHQTIKNAMGAVGFLGRIPAEETSRMLEGVSRGLTRVAEQRERGTKPLGLLGLLGAMRDPDVQAALGAALAFARGFGEALRQRPEPSPPGGAAQ
ncbi:DUF1641 domain-containing protein [Paenibacillus sp.]|uniref:DUF1641 domain-containing protein n=1 Tax=Paenibacillus sp. TaxID=58172 RepID=UPI002D5C2E52|nr:DUF1641 domain-containing protein [Paenibacillus sp.]HZG85353.1 DUF1641 domain-containing protein [Paenibacillus sp.]